MEELVQHALERVVANRDLLQPPHRVADHVDRLAHRDLALLGDQPVPAELLPGRPAVGAGLHRHQGVVQVFVGQEQRGRVQPVGGDRAGVLVRVDLAVELGHGMLGGGDVGQHVVVGQQQPLADQRPGPRGHQPPPPVIGEPRHGPRRPASPGQKVDRLEVVGGVDDPLQQHVRLHLFHGSDRLHQRLGLQLPGLRQPRGPGPNPLGRVHHPGPLDLLPPLQLLAVPRHLAIPLGRRRHLLPPVHRHPPQPWPPTSYNDRPWLRGAVSCVTADP